MGTPKVPSVEAPGYLTWDISLLLGLRDMALVIPPVWGVEGSKQVPFGGLVARRASVRTPRSL